MRAVAAALTVVALVGGVGAETVVSSNILESASWGAEGSPYVVTRDVRVRFDATLTIGQGVEVRFEPGTGLATDAGSSIVASGTEAAPVVFTSTLDGSPGDWEGIEIYDSPGTALTRCVIRNATTCLELNVSDVVVDHCTFTRSETGLRCLRSSPVIEGCTFTDLSSSGLYCWSRESVPRIEDSNFTDNTWNVYLASYAPPLLTIDAERNWWGATTASAIAATIRDRADNAAVYAVVDYEPWLNGAPVERASWGRIKSLFTE